jgi:carbamate kinase
MRIVIAVGGNALLPRGARLDAAVQLAQLSKVAPELGAIAHANQVVIVHGNGPQVGMLALESGADPALARPYPLDDLVAETQGMIGYWLQQEVSRHSHRPAVTLITRTLVDAADPAFAEPTKFIGPAYDRSVAESLAAVHGWTVRPDGAVWRRVVASPTPYEVLELNAADRLLECGCTVVMGGGGGVPVAYRDGRLSGIEAVVDKDLVAGEIAEQLYADLFVVLTDVPAVMTGFGTAEETPVGQISAEALDRLELPAGSMGPKAAAVAKFVRNTGHRAAIGSLDELAAVVDGRAGTQVTLADRAALTSGRTS